MEISFVVLCQELSNREWTMVSAVNATMTTPVEVAGDSAASGPTFSSVHPNSSVAAIESPR